MRAKIELTTFESLLANYFGFWANAYCYKLPNIEVTIKPSSQFGREAFVFKLSRKASDILIEG